MELRDLFVATVALTLGGMMLYTAALNEGWCFQMKVARMIEESKGRAKARTFVGSIGTLMVVVGLYLLFAPVFAAKIFQTLDNRNTNDRGDLGKMSLVDAE